MLWLIRRHHIDLDAAELQLPPTILAAKICGFLLIRSECKFSCPSDGEFLSVAYYPSALSSAWQSYLTS